MGGHFGEEDLFYGGFAGATGAEEEDAGEGRRHSGGGGRF